MFSIIKKMFSSETIDYSSLMEKGAIIIDVRNPREFSGGHVKNAVNVPLGSIQNHVLKLKRQGKPIIACCRSGARSGQATTILTNAGIEAYNGGSWNQVQNELRQL